MRAMRIGGFLLALTAAGCNGCGGVGNKTITVKFTVNGQDAAAGCSVQNAASVVARGRWTTGETSVSTSSARAHCSDGSVKLDMGGTGTIQVTAYESEADDAVALGTSAPVKVTLGGLDVATTEVNVDLIPLRGLLTVTARCTGLGGAGGSCAGKIMTTGQTDAGSLAPVVDFMLDVNGSLQDLQLLEEQALTLDATTGFLTAQTHHASVGNTNVVLVSAHSLEGVRLLGRASVIMHGVQVTADVELAPAVLATDAGVVATDAGNASSGSGSGSSRGSSGAVSQSTSNPLVASSSAPASSVGVSSSATVSGSASVGASSLPAASSASAGLSSSAPASSAGSSSGAGESSSAAASSAIPSSSTAATSLDPSSSSAAGQSSS